MRPARSSSLVSFCLLFLSVVLGWLSPAAAQQQEKRIALVVGDGAYTKAPLATAANDAGLIAQTLQAAGFDVIGARDLDGDTLRKSFRDFIQKAEASGPDTVAMVYLAGYGVQLAGENYFIPVDSNIGRDTDIPIEGLRISDYTRQLGSLPLKASVVVLDGAREQPFIEGGQQQIASGLALVEPENNMLIAFNAAPGTVAPTESGDYGVYAQALAEMIRTGGLSLADVFDRVRLRVNENSKGAQIPWDAQKLQTQFAFFERAPDAPPVQGPADQVAAIRTKPIHDLPVRDAYAACLERDTLQGYEDFVAAYPSDPLAWRVRAIIAARREAVTWRRTHLVDTPQAYWSYLQRYPHGPHAWDARRRLANLSAALQPPPSFAVIDYDVPPPPPDEIVIVDRPVVYFGDPVFAFEPPPPPPVFFLPPPPPDFVVLPPPFAPVGLFILPQPVFVPIPAFVRPPVYVAPPPNNIIYNNIHNATVINNVINQSSPPLPGNPQAAVAAAASGRPIGAAPPPPPSVHQAALAIQKSPTPQLTPSQQAFVAHPTAKPGTPGLIRTNAPAATPAVPPRNALPGSRPGAPLPETGKGTAPPGATPGGAPGARLAPTTPPPPSGAAPPGAHPETRLAPPQSPPGTTPPRAGTGAPSANVAPSPLPPGQPNRANPAVTPPSRPSTPSAKLSAPPPPPPRPESKQHAAPPPPPAAHVTPPRSALHAPPPPAAHAPPPPAAHAAPPPAVHVVPPPQHAPPHAASPPPAAHAQPPPVAHAPPPPVAHAAPPPPRPVAPQAPGPKRCKPGERC